MIVDAGMREMLVEQQDVFYCITLMNENYANPDLPEGAADGVLKGGYRFGSCGPPDGQRVTLVGSGAIFAEVVKAAEQLARQGVGVDVFSITNWSELARDGVAQEAEGADAYVTRLLTDSTNPIVAATDYVRALPESVRAFMPPGRRYATLGTDGFGHSDTRAALRSFFQVDAVSIVARAKAALEVKA